MANDESAKSSNEFFQMFTKAKEFTEEVLKENERLRFKIARLETAGGVPGIEDRAVELQGRVRQLEERLAEMEARYRKVEEENKEFADRYIEINLIGAEAFHVFMAGEKTPQMELESSEGQEAGATVIAIGEGPIGKAAKTGESFFADRVSFTEATPFEDPIAVIPLKIKDSVIGVISINKLLEQKRA